ncbi:hypothetical protein AVEN_104101-1, partial [Araneus ventricosus]
MVPIAAALGEDGSSLSISRSTVHRVRKKARSEFVDVVAKNYAPKYHITIHWYTKILLDIVGIEIVDRLCWRWGRKSPWRSKVAIWDRKKCSRSNLQNTGAM